MKQTYPLPGLYGWAATAAVVVIYDRWAIVNQRPTMSRTLGHYLHRPILGPVLAGAWAGLCYHLLVEERFTAIDQVLVASPVLPEVTTPPSQI